jgi:hypothetical protein
MSISCSACREDNQIRQSPREMKLHWGLSYIGHACIQQSLPRQTNEIKNMHKTVAKPSQDLTSVKNININEGVRLS